MTRNRLIGGAVFVGLALLTVGVFLSAVGQESTAHIIGFQRTGDDRKIVVIISTSLLVDILERQVKEDDASVRVTVRVRDPGGTVPGVAVVLPVVVSLKEPLGTRTVLDENGARAPDRGDYVLPPAGP